MDGAAAVRNSSAAVLLVGDDDGEDRLRDVGTGRHQRAERAQILRLAHDDEMPRLLVRRAGGKAAGLDNPGDDLRRNRFLLVIADRHDRTNRIEDRVRHQPIMARGLELGL